MVFRMSKVKNIQQNDQNELFKAILSLKSIQECQSFFADLCSPAELVSLSERWKVARLLSQEIPYRKISEQTGVSTATIARVARSLTYGTGYQLALDTIKKDKI